ncbi:aminoglycoside adenylyltransferase [Bacillus glycinifermentans]|uniref:Aminoglycoside 6-adenylyltransferase n=1 Tax=Bacillus glycinifermentans TaxID=1664069 RepID=A0A0J6ES88_9BACI|nr:aminoglycoside 6-adenylyltransferase [Bacillus glycinifermentans]ATH94125.1 aminoglycoside 6-adenylyltransferase [Bacillus glycinifermentans]KMM63361.1 aminoglycoside adenylyltransferase [Bacillus glycinifermentans]KRT95556.1 aminoglycoside adenylyltransferase [Bacillus glycinifermentans]MEC0484576.1 aminoglycoside 6-adenylyltransferase [Bacillus glycinifermentans]MEC0496535.1 aminoglycoside 6-adenylyltransferase [Bacillus glycinifermentans]
MRSEQEIMDLVLKVAKEDDRVRAVGMNGSRTNPNVPKDPFRDYDIAYLVTDMQSFFDDPDWIDVFGERIIMQTPEDMELFPNELGDRFTYMMLFTDGNRIDLMLIPLEEKDEYCREDGLTVILLDKDGALPAIPPPTDEEYWVNRPSEQAFADCCNECWWTSAYVAKGLWRQEILYAIDHLVLVRAMLLKMLEWKVGIETDFSLSIGKNAKFLKRYVDEGTWNRLLATYPHGDYDDVWNALFTSTELFEKTAIEVAEHLGYEYPHADAAKVRQYLKHVRQLKPDAKEIY